MTAAARVGPSPLVERVEFTPLAIPYPKPRRFGRHVITSGENVLVRVYASDGSIGLGESVARPYVYGESATSIMHAISAWFAPAMIGSPIFDTGLVWRRWDLVAQNHAAKAGLDMAMFDLQAQAVGMPLWRWLGGTDNRVPLSWILTYGDPGEVVAEATQRAEQGFRWFKVKVSADRTHDRRVLSRLKAELPGSRFYADANGTLSRADFVSRTHEFADFGIELIEDPLRIDDLDTRRRLWSSSAVPILADEAAKSVGEAATEIASGGVDAFSVKIFRTGLQRSREIEVLARSFGRDCLVGGQGETHVGAAIAAHYAAGLRGAGFDRFPAETSSAYRFDFDLVSSGATLRAGHVELSEAPGSGLVLDGDAIDGLLMDRPVTRSVRVGRWYRA